MLSNWTLIWSRIFNPIWAAEKYPTETNTTKPSQVIDYKRAEVPARYSPHQFKPKSLDQHRDEVMMTFQAKQESIAAEARAIFQKLQEPATTILPGRPFRAKGVRKRHGEAVTVLLYRRHEETRLEQIDHTQVRLGEQIDRLGKFQTEPVPVRKPVPIPKGNPQGYPPLFQAAE